MNRNRRLKRVLINREDKYRIKRRRAYRRRMEGIAAVAAILFGIVILGIAYCTVM